MMLIVDHLSIAAAAMPLIRDVSLQIAAGSNLTLLGESGSGKSLLAHAIMGTLPASLHASGTIQVGAHRSPAGEPQQRHHLWGRDLALLPQEPWTALDPTMRVRQQIAETHQLVAGLPAQDALAASLAGLRALGMEAAAGKYPFQVSGGMAQRVAFLATHAAGAPMLIIDEPTKGLDAGRRADIVAMLRAAIAAGVTLLTITHDVWLARALGGDIAVMRDGALVEQGPANAVLTAPSHAYTQRLLAAEPSAWPLHSGAAASTAPVVARMKGLSKSFGAHTLFRNIDAEIRRGEVVAITGPSGAGKTTFGNIVLGLVKPDQGSVQRGAGLAATAFQKIYQDPGAAFAPSVTLRQSLQDVVNLHRLSWDELTPLLARLHLRPQLLDRLPAHVSGGELQRFALARVLLLRPALIFADEATSRLDPITQQETLTLLVEHAALYQCAVFLVTHDHAIAARLAQRHIDLA